MTNAERKTHVIRILGTNKAGDVLPEMWADVERIDRMEIMTQVIQGPAGAVNQYQKVTIKLRWLDDPDANDYDEKGDKNREHKIVKVCDPSLPQDKLDDPDEWIPIRSIVRMEVKHVGGNIIKHFKESDPTINYDGRVVATRRITHWDTTIDEAAQAAFDADPTRKVYVEPDGNRKYERIEDTEDKDQYVEHQIVKKLNRQDAQQMFSTGSDQRRVLYLRNQYQIDESHPAKLEELGKGEINPPYRLDPFQNIINVQMGGATEIPVGSRQVGWSQVAPSQTVTVAFWYDVGKIADWKLGDYRRVFVLGNDTVETFHRPEHTEIGLFRSFTNKMTLNVQFGGVKNAAFVFLDPINNSTKAPCTAFSAFASSVTEASDSTDAVDGWNFFSVSFDSTRTCPPLAGPVLFPVVSGVINTKVWARPLTDATKPPGDDQVAAARPRGEAEGGAFGDANLFTNRLDPNGTPWPLEVDLNAPVNIPSRADDSESGSERIMSLRIWNSYIDFEDVDVIKKFVILNPDWQSDTDQKYLMVDSSVANDPVNGFGSPVLWFEGSPGAFKKERVSAKADQSGVGDVYTQEGEKFKSIPPPKKAPKEIP